MAKLYVGTSGFSYREWKGLLYPSDLPPSAYLAYYAERLGAVEINTSFYRAPSVDTLNTWVSQVPDGFRFIFKMNRQITHSHRLKPEGDEYLSFFLDRLASIGEKLGPILFQFPPYFQLDLNRLERVVLLLPSRLRFAFEFRHPSWDDPGVRNLLRSSGAAWCIADMESSPVDPKVLRPMFPFAYLRLRRQYSTELLYNWADVVSQWLGMGLDVYVFFKHEETGTGPQYAISLQELLSAVPAI